MTPKIDDDRPRIEYVTDHPPRVGATVRIDVAEMRNSV